MIRLCEDDGRGISTMDSGCLGRGMGRIGPACLLFILAGAGNACDDNPCPDKDGYDLCGYCAEDVVTSSNPNAGKCRYCPIGSTCGEPCTMTDCGGGGGGACATYVINCGAVNNGVEVVGGVVPMACPCPNNTHQTGEDNVTAGGPYRICTCN